MAKYYNNQKKTGKVAGSVFAIRFGETIERAYNPVVNNPNTEAQIEARAKMKLMSQLGAILGKTIAIPRQGAASPRNLFVKKNYPLVTYADNQADITLTDVKVTNSAVGIPPLAATRAGARVTASLTYVDADIDKMVYLFIVKNDDNTLRLERSAVAERGDSGYFEAEVSVANLPTVVLGYGIRENTEAARVTFGDLTALSAETVAKIIVSRTLLDSDITVSETRGVDVIPSA